jgi:hypothetical protein
MTSGMIECPNCKEPITIGAWKDGEYITESEPWLCANCRELVETDKDKGYGLRIRK